MYQLGGWVDEPWDYEDKGADLRQRSCRVSRLRRHTQLYIGKIGHNLATSDQGHLQLWGHLGVRNNDQRKRRLRTGETQSQWLDRHRRLSTVGTRRSGRNTGDAMAIFTRSNRDGLEELDHVILS